MDMSRNIRHRWCHGSSMRISQKHTAVISGLEGREGTGGGWGGGGEGGREEMDLKK